MHFAKGTFHKRTDDQSNHLVKETIAIEFDRDTRTFLPDAHRINCADRILFRLAAIRSEAGEIVRAHEMFGSRFECSEIERARDMPGAAMFEWRQNRR